jgi:hypothetical protein
MGCGQCIEFVENLKKIEVLPLGTKLSECSNFLSVEISPKLLDGFQ